jgi:hypothetical protein
MVRMSSIASVCGFAALVLTLGGCGGSEEPTCGSANQCVAASSSGGSSYSIRNACSNAITVRWCEEYAGPKCSTDQGFTDVFGGGQSRSYTAVRPGLITVTYCAF